MPMKKSGEKLVVTTARAVASAFHNLHAKDGHEYEEVLRCALWHVAAYTADGIDLFEEEKETILIDSVSCLNFFHGLDPDANELLTIRPPRLVK